MNHFTFDNAAVGHRTVLHLCLAADVVRRFDRIFAVNLPAAVKQTQLFRVVQQIHVRFPQAADGPDILPVAAETIRDQFHAIGQHFGDDVLTKIILAVGSASSSINTRRSASQVNM